MVLNFKNSATKRKHCKYINQINDKGVTLLSSLASELYKTLSL